MKLKLKDELDKEQKNNHSDEEELMQRSVIIENDFLEGEILKISYDVYNLTIAANLTGEVSPVHLNTCIKQCFTVFII